VSPSVKARGVGSKLIDALKGEVDFEAYEYITLETDVVDNEAANRFYQKNGFCISREYETHEGRKMYEYRYAGEKNENGEASLHTERCESCQ
ncbi:MAG: GNAT family N-acetyltransferase, partial [Clostridia bacterium]|nr:GNAT family N-acetyltransferase [Clostridia bacterium]